MSLPTTLLTLLLLTLAFSLKLEAQDVDGIFTSGSGGFSISTPGEPTDRGPVFFKLGETQLSGDIFVWRSNDEITTIEVYRVFARGSGLSVLQKKTLIDLYKKNILEKTGRLVDKTTERPYIFLGSNGVELRSDSIAKMVVRILFLNQRLIVLSTASKNDQNFETQLEQLESFRMLSKEQHISVLLRESTPLSLPQESEDTSIPSDLSQVNVKGKVTEIFETYQASASSEKEPLKDSFLNKNGNLVREISYVGGYPNQVRVWGWIDRKRVFSSATINYSSDAHLDPNRPKMSIDGQRLRNILRFDDSKRVIEREVHGPTSLSYREKFTYSAASVDKQVVDGSGGFLSRTFEVVDQNGNVTEERTLDNAGRSAGIRYFEYEFDAKGNWTTKKEYVKPIGRNLPRKLVGIYSRTIKYAAP